MPRGHEQLGFCVDCNWHKEARGAPANGAKEIHKNKMAPIEAERRHEDDTFLICLILLQKKIVLYKLLL